MLQLSPHSVDDWKDQTLTKRTLAPYLKRIEFLINNSDTLSALSGSARILFIGCGDGEEALALQEQNQRLTVIGLDVRLLGTGRTGKKLEFVRADALKLPFRDGALDFCYCFHVLEHVLNYSTCIAEIARVLNHAGELFLSTPNKKCLLRYLLSTRRESFQTVVRWNFREWRARLKGEFLTEKGYHLGFTLDTLSAILSERFHRIRFVTEEYTIDMAQGTVFALPVTSLRLIHALQTVAPSHTVLCRIPRSRTSMID